MSPPDQERQTDYGDEAVEQPAEKALGYGNKAVVAQADSVVIAQAAKVVKPRGRGGTAAPALESFQVEFEPGKVYTVAPKKEIAPPGTSASRFRGYLTLYHGLAAAFGLDRIGYVYELTDGRARVYDTGQKAYRLSDEPGLIVARQHPTRISRSRFTKLYRSAQDWDDQRQALQTPNDFADLLIAMSELRPHEVHVMSSPQDFREGVVSIDPYIPFKGVGGIEGGLKTILEEDKPLPTLFIRIGNAAISVSHPMYTMMTLAHEATHETHARRTLELVRQWREARKGTKLDFSSWLQRESDRGRITFEDFQIAEEQAKNLENTTQTISHVEGFTIGYHHLPVPDKPAHEAFHDLILIEDRYWRGVHLRLKNAILERLKRYASALDEARRDVLKANLSEAPDEEGFRRKLLDAIE